MSTTETQAPLLQRHFTCATVETTHALGYAVGQTAYPGLIVALHGELGAGKTTLTQGVARGLAISAPVTSPTFTLVNEYASPAGWRLVHIDTYRLGDANTAAMLEAATFGMEEILEEALALDAFGATPTVVVIEWAERVAALLPADHLSMLLQQTADDGRLCTATAYGARSEALLKQLNFFQKAV
jgi:tRNA threonylcarbamoyladenosine biosynthesis protein TsaE